MPGEILSMTGISKVFGGVIALDKVQFNLRAGEVHALIGENGAGKSTLMKVLLGLHKRDGGEIVFDGKTVTFADPAEALRSGVSMIHQEVNLVHQMSVSENIWLGRERLYMTMGLISTRKRDQATKELLRSLEIEIEPSARVNSLSIGQMQLVELARAVSHNPRIIIMDEPTSALTDQEVEKLYRIIRSLTAKGVAIVFISHKLEELYQIVGETNIKLDEPMKKHTTFRIGGPADCLITPNTVEELEQVLAACNAAKEPFFILGNGSNLLVSDAGIEGVVIQLFQNFNKFTIEGTIIKAQAGVLLSKIGNAVKQAGLTGFEFAAGIPGSLGGAMVMNAGAYGGEMKDIVQAVQLMDYNGNLLELSGEEMHFAYRHSIVHEKKYIVIGATIKLEYGEKDKIEARMEELALARKTKQPLEYPSAGSTFKRPEGYFAGKLIQDAGMRGYCVGDAQVSEKHCGFVINKGNATASDVMQLICDVQKKVKEQTGVDLEPEVMLTGR